MSRESDFGPRRSFSYPAVPPIHYLRENVLGAALPDNAAFVALKPGDRLGGKYKLEQLLGQGAAGQVWLAVHETIGRTVAVKVLRNEAKGRAAVRFLQEARIAASLQSRYVVSTFDFGNTSTGLLYMVMEHLHGETLGARLMRSPPLRVRDLLRYLGQALTGLHEVHRAGIVHRDLKPENIFLVEEGGEIFAKILDFGVSRADDAGMLGPEMSKLTATGMTVGTPLYMAPEQARGKRQELDARTDLYAIGVILYRAISGQAPFGDANVVDLLMAAVSATVAPALIDVRPDVPEALSEVVQKAMAPRQDRRYADAEALRMAMSALHTRIPETLACTQVGGRPASTDEFMPLSTLLPHTDMDPTMPASMVSSPGTARRFVARWWVWGAASAVMLVALVATVALLWNRAAPPAALAPHAPAQTQPVELPAIAPAVDERVANPAPAASPKKARPQTLRRKPSAPSKSASEAPEVFTHPGF